MNRVKAFVDSFIPENLPKKKRLELKDELECHILDKADFYKEIGYSLEDSIEKAIEDFGTKDEMRTQIYNEFEELYYERSWFGIIAFAIVSLMNFLCFPLGLWVMSADYNRDPDPISIFVSFCMIFLVLFIVTFARIKKFRKTLISIGVANLLIAVTLLWSFYPQMASFGISYNLVYLIDRFTPISFGDMLTVGGEGTFAMMFYIGFLVIPSVYCFVEAFRIKRGLAKEIQKPWIKTGAFTAIFYAVAIITSLMYPAAEKYIDDYPVWFNEYSSFICEETEDIFEEIRVGNSYEYASEILASRGYTTVEGYEKTLDKLTLKQFRNDIDNLAFADGYEIWFNSNEIPRGNGFVGIMSKNGVVTGVAIGNMSGKIYDENYGGFGMFNSDFLVNISLLTEYLETVEKGDSEQEIMENFVGLGTLGSVYCKRFITENGVEKHYYRVYSRGPINPDISTDYYKEVSRYTELYFENGILTEGTLYWRDYVGDGYEVSKQTLA